LFADYRAKGAVGAFALAKGDVDVKKHFDLCFCRILADFEALSRGV